LLARFARDVQDCDPTFKIALPTPLQPIGASAATCVLARNGTDLICHVRDQSRIVLEDLDFVQDAGDAKDWATYIGQRLFPGDATWQGMFTRRFCIVHDDVLTFLLLTATEVTARIKLNDDTKTVDTNIGALWYEEALPTETILSGLMLTTEADKAKIVGITGGKTLQFGGKATIGRGLCRVQIVGAQITPSPVQPVVPQSGPQGGAQ
jgi:CRISPR-associated protein Cmr4